MEFVDTTMEPWFLMSVPADMVEEVTRFVEAAAAVGITLRDVEFYGQKDGRVAVLDWDQCRT